jgi:DNA polymerase-1
MPSERLFLIDAMGYIFRAYHVPMARLANAAGVPTKVPYIFANMIRRLLKLKDLPVDYVGVVFDPPGKTFRDELFAAYKAQRPPMPEDMKVQLPYVRRMCAAMRLPALEYPGYEADDVIGAFTRQAVARALDVVIITSDKDMLQLVGPQVRVLIPTKNDLLVDVAKVEELLGLPPEKVTDYMALLGDSVDNIPGAKGIGEKGARELIQRFGSAEEALERAGEVEGKRYREALQNSREQVLMSKKLATIATDVPLHLDLEALRVQEPDAAALRLLYAELGFTSLLKELPSTPGQAEGAPAQVDTTALASAEELRRFLGAVPPTQPLAVWLAFAPSERESEGYGSRVAALEISGDGHHAATIWVDAQGEVLAALRAWLSTSAHPKIVHDPKLLHLLLLGGVTEASQAQGLFQAQGAGAAQHAAGKMPPLQNVQDATQLYSYLLRPTTAKHDVADAAARHLSETLGDAPGTRAGAMVRLAPVLRREVQAAGLLPLYETIDLPLAPVLARMEMHGVRVDPAALGEMSGAMERELRGIEKRIIELAGFEFNVHSPQQLAEVLFDKLNLPQPRKYGKGKVRSTAAEVLEELAPLHELPARVIEFREIAKLKSTYVDALPQLIHPHTGRVHTSLNATSTATGRLSSSDPNLQNIPVRTELGRQIRAAFAAEPGWVLLSADYSQIELRILAHFSEDPVLCESFRCGEDIHARTAQEIFGVDPRMQTAEHRRAAKAVNFGIIYGLSPFGLAQQIGVEQKEAAKFIAAYFERYRGVRAWIDRQIAEVKKTGVTRTLHGRVRQIPEINSPHASLRNFAQRTAMNTPFQGTAADLIKLAMIRIDGLLTARSMQSKMILQVHDELLFEVPPEELDALRALVKPAMEHVHELRVPLVADMKSGPNWRDMQ